MQSKVSLKVDDILGQTYSKVDGEMLRVSPENSWFPQEIHVPPKPKYFGKPEGTGLYQNGKLITIIVH